MTISVTNHAAKRFKQRMGLPKKACQRHAETAYEHGATHGEVRGSLKRYMDKLYLQHRTATDIRAYGEQLYLFAGRRLITLFPIPKRMRGGVPAQPEQNDG